MAVLATLALHGGEIVSTGRLVDVVWGNAASPKAVSTLQSHMSFLRSVLGNKAAIVARPPGSMSSWYPIWSRWRPIARWMSRFTPS